MYCLSTKCGYEAKKKIQLVFFSLEFPVRDLSKRNTILTTVLGLKNRSLGRGAAKRKVFLICGRGAAANIVLGNLP